MELKTNNPLGMPTQKQRVRKSTTLLLALLFIEVSILTSLRQLGWLGTGRAVTQISCLLLAVSPVLIAAFVLARNRFRFGLRSLMVAVTLFSIFMLASVKPLLDFRADRSVNLQLFAANAKLDADRDWDDFYNNIGLEPQPSTTSKSANLPPWLTPFTSNISSIPPDADLQSIWLDSDKQIELLSSQPGSFSSLQSISISSGVTNRGLNRLREALPQFAQLYRVHVSGVVVPKNWYRSLRNIHTLFVWGEGPFRGKPFPAEDLADIASLEDLELLMVLGYALNDTDTRVLASSPSLKRIILRGTVVTSQGETELNDPAIDRVVFRN